MQSAQLLLRASNSIAGTWGEEREKENDGEEKARAVDPDWLWKVIEDCPPQCVQRSLIFLCSLVWRLKRLEMTLSVSQAHKGDIEARNHWCTGTKSTYCISFTHECAHTHTHTQIHKRIPQRSYLTAVNNRPHRRLCFWFRNTKHFDLLWRLFFVCLFDLLLIPNIELAEEDGIYEEKLNIGDIMVCCSDSKCSQNGKKSIKRDYNFLIKAILLIWSVPCQLRRKTKTEKWFETYCAFQDKIIFTCFKIYEFVLGFESNWDDLIISFQAN